MWSDEKATITDTEPEIINQAKRCCQFPLSVMDAFNSKIPYMENLFRFSFDYLIKEGYIDSNGNPLQFCGLIAHIHYMEPFNFAFVSLLKDGIFDEICSKSKTESNRVILEEILVILCNLFCRVKLHPKHMDNIQKRYGKKVFGKIVVPNLSGNILASINAHNSRALSITTSFMHATTQVYKEELGEDNVLPLSKLEFSPSLKAPFKVQSIPISVRSAFVALSGNSDNFSSVPELEDTLRSGLVLNSSVIPWVDIGDQPLNAYILDFWSHGQLISLRRLNGLREDVIFENLLEFSLLLKVISVALEKREKKSGVVTKMFTLLSKTFAEKFTNAFPR